MKHPFYLTFGSLLLSMVSYSSYTGWSATKVNELKNVPKTVRDNPGAYRSHYGYYSRYVGGK